MPVRRGTPRGKPRDPQLLQARCRRRHGPRLRLDVPYRDNARSPVSKIDALAPDLVHQRGALAVTTGPERPGLDEGPGIGENFGSEICQAMELAPPIGQIFQKHGDIVIRPLVRIPARAGAEEHETFDPIAVELIEGRAKAPQDRIIGCRSAGSGGSSLLEGSHSANPGLPSLACGVAQSATISLQNESIGETVDPDKTLTAFAQAMLPGPRKPCAT